MTMFILYALIVLFGGVCSFWGPWWVIAPVCFFACFVLARKASSAFWASAAAGVTLWIGYAIYLHLNTEAALTKRVMGVFVQGISDLEGIPAFLMMLIVVVCIVGPLSGFSGLAGIRLRQLVSRP